MSTNRAPLALRKREVLTPQMRKGNRASPRPETYHDDSGLAQDDGGVSGDLHHGDFREWTR